MNNPLDSILEIANTCQNYNIGKMFISALLPSKGTKVSNHKSMKPLKRLCLKNNFVFVEHKNIGFDMIYGWAELLC